MKTLQTFGLFTLIGASFVLQKTSSTTAFTPLQTTATRTRKTEPLLTWKNTSPFPDLEPSYKKSERSESLRSPDEGNEVEKTNAGKPSPLIKLASSPLGALAVIACVVLFHESGHYLTAKHFGLPIDEFSVGLGPKLWGFQGLNGDQFNLRAVPLGGYVSLNTASLLALPVLQRIQILAAGVMFNLLLAFLIYTWQILAGQGLPVAVFDTGIVVGQLDEGACAKGLLFPGDVIQAVNGKKLLASPTTSEMEVQRAISKLIDEVQATPEGNSVVFTVLKDPKTSEVTNVKIQPQRKEGGRASLGVYLMPNFVGVDVRKTENPLEAAVFAASHVATITKETAIGLITFAGDFFSGKSGSSEYRFSGPVGVIKRASEVIKTQDWDVVLKYAAAVSINLGVINCFPIPPSDGFQILFTAAEALWQKL